jgi:hypothetical protein
MQKISAVQTSVKNVFEGQLTIGLDLRDRSSAYCVLNKAGEIVLEHKLASTPEAMKQVFSSMPQCRIVHHFGIVKRRPLAHPRSSRANYSITMASSRTATCQPNAFSLWQR